MGDNASSELLASPFTLAQTESNQTAMSYHTTISGFSPLPTANPSTFSKLSSTFASSRSRAILIIGLIIIGTLAFVSFRDHNDSTSKFAWRPQDPIYSHYLSQPNYIKYSIDSSEYKFAIISDMDTSSRVGTSLVFKAVIKEGKLTRQNGRYRITMEREYRIDGEYNEKGRGMELSELINYNGKLLTCDDRTGIIYEVSMERKIVIPRWILVGGDGKSTAKGLKCEWMTIKNDVLYAGSIGKEFIKDGKIMNQDNTWIKTIDRAGGIQHIDWRPIYEKLREFTGTAHPGYLVHEAIGWSQQMQKWVFLPRRSSTEAYDEKLDELKGANYALIASEDFSSIKKVTVGPQIDSHGFSSFKFIPFREREVLALKSEEYGDQIKSFLTVFDVTTGEVLMEETEISSDTKYEGVEFL